MKNWADKWEDIYIGSRDDLISSSDAHYLFEYQAQQGHFSLNIPKSQCYLIDTDSTVEFIAQHIAQELKNAEPNDKHVVKAYEGLAKGAIVSL